MRVNKIIVHRVRMKLKNPFQTAISSVQDRIFLIAEVEFSGGITGWGECSAFDTPWYTEETIDTCQYVLSSFLIPAILQKKFFFHPKELHSLLTPFRGHHMAKSCLETAFWDAYAKQLNKPLYQVLGGEQNQVDVGVAIGLQEGGAPLLNKVKEAIETGYKRIKLKVKPEHDLEVLDFVRSKFPNLPLMVDANSSYTLEDLPHLQKFDQFGLLMIEQPLGSRDFVDHAKLQTKISTPVCLDESITSFEAAQTAIVMKSCRVIAIKHSRVGGLSEALRIHDLCLKNGVKVWAGGMIESGVGRAHNIALSTLSGFVYPGDIAASSHYWDEDLIYPSVAVNNGVITCSQNPGIGYEINLKHLLKFEIGREVFQ